MSGGVLQASNKARVSQKVLVPGSNPSSITAREQDVAQPKRLISVWRLVAALPHLWSGKQEPTL